MTNLEQDIEARKYAVESSGQNILLSASAGSGKSYTLVERIANRIKNEPGTGIDKMLILTFTRLAAGELREKIGNKLTEMASASFKDGDTEGALRFEKQKLLLSKAEIGTLDMFCKDVVKKHFTIPGIDPNFDTDDHRVKLILRESEETVLEELYGKKGSEEYKVIREIIEVICDYSSDEALKTEIFDKIFAFADTMKDPREWIGSLKEKCADKKFWYDRLAERMRRLYRDAAEYIDDCIRLVDTGGYVFFDPEEYKKVLKSDRELVLNNLRLLDAEDGLFDPRLCAIEWTAKFPSTNKKEIKSDERALFAHRLLTGNTGYRNKGGWINKKTESIIKLKGESAAERKKDFEVGIDKTEKYVGVIADTALEIFDLYTERCREKNVYSFAQIEHFANEILKNEGVRKDYQNAFDEVYIDEYQDTNAIQEAIVTKVSRLPGEHNMFMVGDVKQSIYAFRRATPEFFLEKLNCYKNNPEEGSLRVLGRNFRSRKEVLDSVNTVFDVIMTEKSCGIGYKEDGHDLIYGNDKKYGPAPETGSPAFRSEFITAQKGEEAAAVARRILKLFDDGFKIIDKEERNIRFGDVCILARDNKTIERFREALSGFGIPVSSGSAESIFDRVEVAEVLAFARTVDNPHCDVPLASLMMGSCFGFAAKELARMRLLGGKRADFFDCVKATAGATAEELLETGENMEEMTRLKGKTAEFVSELEFFRGQAQLLNVSVLIWNLINHRNYYAKADGLRKKNLRRLVELAQPFDNGTRGGLYAFIQYVDTIISDEKVKGEKTFHAAAESAGDDAVKFLTVHSSKGLDFPIVFLVGTKPAKEEDKAAGDDFYVDEKCGIGFGFAAAGGNTLSDSTPMAVLRAGAVDESHSEMQRVLYVALTRASEKLIVTAENVEPPQTDKLKIAGNLAIDQCKSFFALLELALSRNDAADTWDFFDDTLTSEEWDSEKFRESIAAFVKESPAAAGKADRQDEALAGNRVESGALDDFVRLADEVSENDRRLPAKLSVSAIKKLTDEEIPEMGDVDRGSKTNPLTLSSTEESSSGGAAFGTVMHKCLQLLTEDRDNWPENKKDALNYVEKFVETRIIQGCFKKKEENYINKNMLADFVASERAAKIKSSSDVRCETPFTVLADIGKYVKTKENSDGNHVAIQGVIDLYYRAENGIALVDFKTDRTDDPENYRLTESYKVQLCCYRDALEKISGEKVTESILYFLRTGKEITL